VVHLPADITALPNPYGEIESIVHPVSVSCITGSYFQQQHSSGFFTTGL